MDASVETIRLKEILNFLCKRIDRAQCHKFCFNFKILTEKLHRVLNPEYETF